MNEELNLVDILKNVPVGTEFYCSVVGECKFLDISKDEDYPIHISCSQGKDSMDLDEYGKEYRGKGECLLFPSKDQRDWSKFEIPEVFEKDEPVMCSVSGIDWFLRYHTGKGRGVYCDGFKSDEYEYKIDFPHIIKVSEFDFINRCKK